MGGMRNIVPSKQEHEDDDSTLNMAVSHALRTFMRETIKAPNIDREWVGVMGSCGQKKILSGSWIVTWKFFSLRLLKGQIASDG